jgi:hypothetical protein
MSKKSKLILATAVFGAALFGASCGGGGGTTAGGGGGSGGGGGGTEPTEEGKVLALLDAGGSIAGSLRPVTICSLMSDQTAKCGPTDLNPNANLDLQYVHEFQNGNVLLLAGDVLYLFDGSQVRRLDTFRSLTSATTNTAAGGVTVPANAFISRLPNLVMMFNAGGDFVAVAENGTVIVDNGVNPTGASCPTVTSGGNTFSISANGNVSSLTPARTIQNVLASAGGKFLVYDSNNRLYLRDDPCLPDGQSISAAPIAGVNDAQMVKVGNDFYIAVNTGAALNYYRVSGSSSTLVATAPDAAAGSAFLGGRFDYTLDGEGRLYVAVDTDGDNALDQVDIYHPNNTTGRPNANTNAFGGNNVVAMLGFANRVLAIDDAVAPNLYDIQPNATVTPLPADATLQNHFDNCTDAKTKAVDGIGTNFIRCLYDDGTVGGNGQNLSSIAFVGGQYRRPTALVQIAPAPGAAPARAEVAANDILFGANALIVRHAINNNILLCTTTSTTSPSISCSDPGVFNAAGQPLGFADLNLLFASYLKSNGSEVFYRSGTTLFVGDVFNPTPLSIPLTIPPVPTGGNASFDLNKFAFGSIPPGGNCRNRIVYLSSRTASAKIYTITQPSNVCLSAIFKVY